MRKSLIDRIQEIADEIEQDGGIIIRRNLSDEELIEIDERFAGLKHREALALSLSENSWTMIRDLIQNERYKELKALITSDLLADADSIISSLSPKTGIVSMFD